MYSTITEKDYILSVHAHNNQGVLLRISGLLSRRGYNIQSIMAASTKEDKFARILIVVHGDETVISQVEKQLLKLVEVKSVRILNRDDSVVREHMLVKVEKIEGKTNEIVAVTRVFEAKVLNVTADNIILEITGSPRTLNSFLECCSGFNVRDVVRTGIIAMEFD